MQLEHVVTTDAHRPALCLCRIWTESERLSRIAIWGRKIGGSRRDIIVLETLIVSTERKRVFTAIVLETVKLACLVEDIVRNVPSVLLQAWESTRLAETELSF